MVRAISFINSMDSGVRHGRIHGLAGNQNVPQDQLQRIELVVIDINQRIKERVPVPYRIIQNHNGDDCLGQRDYHPHKILEHVAAVDLRGLLQLQRQRIYKKGAAQYQVENGKRAKYHQYIGRIGEMQPFDDQVGGNQAAGKILGDDQQLHDQRPCPPYPAGKGHSLPEW